ncbi:hypothetical protein FA15DRAFT_641439 [Coprinopsis marcescibilis]|uniref:Ricin B lectin domain-containing protein n=1 Tax=Coprinopsis marcescibilis TaxID=230819 RepID=A0A5C3KUQ4_COPMA|nr:hypothetical protein FA15DRAFT_641439 [Coprinopsis marcescibilis]
MVQLENGKVYRFVSPRFRAVLELEDRTKRVVLNDFTGSSWQQWKAIKAGGLWKFSNVASGLYLGTDFAYSPSNGVELFGTANDEFVWQLKLATSTDHPTALKLFVPYTQLGLDASAAHGSVPGGKVHFWDLGDCQTNQIWIVDRLVDPIVPCVQGSIYKISNVQSGTVAHIESNGNVRGYEYNEGRNQLWEAIHESSNPYLWSFKNIFNGLYLGIKGDLAKKDTHIVGTKKAFKWRLVVDSFDSNKFQIYAPHVNLSIDLHNNLKDPGTLMHLWSPIRDRHWRFEKVDVPDRSLPVWASEYPGATPCECSKRTLSPQADS